MWNPKEGASLVTELQPKEDSGDWGMWVLLNLGEVITFVPSQVGPSVLSKPIESGRQKRDI